MPVVNLDRNTVKECLLPAGKRAEFYWDTTLKGFGFVIRRDARGTIQRSWLVQYRFGGQQRKQKIADCAKLNADQARRRATEMFAQLVLGTDPAAEKDAARAKAATLLTFAKATEQYLAMKEREVQNGDYRPASLKNTRLYLTGARYFEPLHKRGLNEVQRSDLAACLNKIGTDSGEVSRGVRGLRSAPFTSGRCKKVLQRRTQS
jgi:hypothetical protein